MHSYYNKLLPNHFENYFISISFIHSHATRLSTSNSLFLPRVNPSQQNVPLHLLAQRCGFQYQTVLSLQPLLLSNGKLKSTSYMKKVYNYVL